MENIKSEKELTELKNVSTAQLVSELKRREGVEVKIAEPYQEVNLTVNGPAIVMVVKD